MLFVDNKAIAVLEAKCEENQLGKEVEDQVEYYAHHPRGGDGVRFPDLVPLVYISNGSDRAKLELLACAEGVTMATYGQHMWLAEQE